MKIIALDGISNSGKTTMCKLNEQDFHIVPEPHFVTDYNFDLTFDKTNIVCNAQKTLELEKLRNDYIKNSNIKNSMIIDRSILSYVAISFSYKKSEVDYFADFANWVIEMINNNQITLPDVYVILKRDFKACQILLKQKNLPEYWCSESFASYQQYVFDKFAKTFKNSTIVVNSPIKLKEIDISNKTKVTKEQFIQFLKELSQC